MCSFNGVWKGKTAKFFELCRKSDYKEELEVEVEFNTWEWFAERENILWYGTVDPTSAVFCLDLPYIAKGDDSSISKYAKMAYTTIGNYVWNNYREEGGITLPSIIGALW